MLTTAEYAERVTAGDDGWWLRAVRHAVDLISPRLPAVDYGRLVPVPQLMVQTAALVVYGLARSRRADPGTVGATELLAWVSRRRLPSPPGPPGPGEAGPWWWWRYEVDHAAERQRHDLAELLEAAGHRVPAPGHRNLERSSSDPVIATWLALVDTEPPDSGPVSTMDTFPAPLLSLGLSALGDMG